MDKQLKQLRNIYEKYDASIKASPYYRFIALAQEAGNTRAAIRIGEAIQQGGISFIPYHKEGSLIGKDYSGKTYGRPYIDDAVQIINKQMKRSNNFNESDYWIYMVDNKGDILIKLSSNGTIM